MLHDEIEGIGKQLAFCSFTQNSGKTQTCPEFTLLLYLYNIPIY